MGVFKLTCGFELAGNYAEKEFLRKTHFYLRFVEGRKKEDQVEM